MQQATIAAIATAQAAGGISVIRISGPEALPVCARVFSPKNNADLTASPGYRAYFGTVHHNNTPLDEAVCLVFRAPHSYTGEDVAELSVHGGLYLTQQVLRAVLAAGAIPAVAGEFTKRAFLNGRIDLTQAEAVMSLIGAQGELAAKAAYSALDGALQQTISACAARLVSTLAQLGAWVDYPDEEIPDLSAGQLGEVFSACASQLQALLARFDSGKAVTEGVNTVIVGRPNVGKSTLMNLLSGSERSIVTAYPGTTRDIVEETVRLGDIVLRIADTAGLRETENPVEQIGVARAKSRLASAQLIFAVFDSADPLTQEDKNILAACAGTRTIAVVNKADLPQRLDDSYLAAHSDALVQLSAATGEGYDTLCSTVRSLLGADRFNPADARLATERQHQCCTRALEALLQANEALDAGVTLDAVTVCAQDAVDALLELTGEKASEAIVDALFAQFCVGK